MEQTKQYEYVDLGLPSGLKWAKCNVGAEKETDYGDYFMWGSTISNNDTLCDWEHAPFNNGSGTFNYTYFNSVKDTVCPNGILAKEYDTATQIMDSDWRMPTEAEFDELLNGTTNEWIINFNGTGINGRKFTSKTDTSKYIFIPVAGSFNDSSVGNVGDYGNVWSSSLDTSYPFNAWGLLFSSGYCSIGSYRRFLGWSVRGVMK